MKGFENTQEPTRKELRKRFVEYDGENRCIRCCFYYIEKKCRKAKCTPEEREDGKQGYFRDDNPVNREAYIHMTEYRTGEH